MIIIKAEILTNLRQNLIHQVINPLPFATFDEVLTQLDDKVWDPINNQLFLDITSTTQKK